MTRQDMILECKSRYAAGEQVDKLIDYLREVCCSKIESIAIISSGCGIGLSKAKEAVHFSSTWDHVRTRDNELHEMIEDAMSENEQKKIV